eukprot:7059949-Prymnesium_polylepis.1
MPSSPMPIMPGVAYAESGREPACLRAIEKQTGGGPACCSLKARLETATPCARPFLYPYLEGVPK